MSAFEGQNPKGFLGAGEDALLDAWARDFREPLRRYFAKRCPRTIEPDDLVQEVFMRLARRADLAAIESVEGYLFQTAASVLTDRFRKDARAPAQTESFEEDAHGSAELTPERVLIGKETLQEVRKALHELPEKTRAIFMLYHFENMRQGKIAAALGMPLSTVEKHMARANKHLFKRMKRNRRRK